MKRWFLMESYLPAIFTINISIKTLCLKSLKVENGGVNESVSMSGPLDCSVYFTWIWKSHKPGPGLQNTYTTARINHSSLTHQHATAVPCAHVLTAHHKTCMHRRSAHSAGVKLQSGLEIKWAKPQWADSNANDITAKREIKFFSISSVIEVLMKMWERYLQAVMLHFISKKLRISNRPWPCRSFRL